MVTYNSGPINIQKDNSATFAIEYLSTSGYLTVPSSGGLTVTYINNSNISVTDNVTLTESNSIFTGVWSSTSAALGLATWQATMAGSTVIQAAGQVRVLQRMSTY